MTSKATTTCSAQHTALIVIDIQNEYFEGGALPLWQAQDCLQTTLRLIQHYQQQQSPVILIQHLADNSQGPTGSFDAGSNGAALHPDLLTSAADAPVIVKHYADSFFNTGLAELLKRLQIQEIHLCGMMTQNCVTHTALSPEARDYQVNIIADACTTISPLLHQIAIRALSARHRLLQSTDLLAAGTD